MQTIERHDKVYNDAKEMNIPIFQQVQDNTNLVLNLFVKVQMMVLDLEIK